MLAARKKIMSWMDDIHIAIALVKNQDPEMTIVNKPDIFSRGWVAGLADKIACEKTGLDNMADRELFSSVVFKGVFGKKFNKMIKKHKQEAVNALAIRAMAFGERDAMLFLSGNEGNCLAQWIAGNKDWKDAEKIADDKENHLKKLAGDEILNALVHAGKTDFWWHELTKLTVKIDEQLWSLKSAHPECPNLVYAHDSNDKPGILDLALLIKDGKSISV